MDAGWAHVGEAEKQLGVGRTRGVGRGRGPGRGSHRCERQIRCDELPRLGGERAGRERLGWAGWGQDDDRRGPICFRGRCATVNSVQSPVRPMTRARRPASSLPHWPLSAERSAVACPRAACFPSTCRTTANARPPNSLPIYRPLSVQALYPVPSRLHAMPSPSAPSSCHIPAARSGSRLPPPALCPFRHPLTAQPPPRTRHLITRRLCDRDLRRVSPLVECTPLEPLIWGPFTPAHAQPPPRDPPANDE